MSIEVTCACGKTYRFKDDNAGRHAKCPACGEVIRVPGEAPLPQGVPVAMPPKRGMSGAEKGALVAAAVGVVALAIAIPVLMFRDPKDPRARAAVEPAPPPSQETAVLETPPPIETAPESAASAAPAPAEPAVPEAPEPPPSPAEPARVPERVTDPITVHAGPRWARIVLDEGLFPDGMAWASLSNRFAMASTDGLSPWDRLALDLTPPVPVAALADRHGSPEMVDQSEGTEWHCYGPLAFGVKPGEDQYRRARAPIKMMRQGLAVLAREAVDKAVGAEKAVEEGPEEALSGEGSAY